MNSSIFKIHIKVKWQQTFYINSTVAVQFKYLSLFVSGLFINEEAVSSSVAPVFCGFALIIITTPTKYIIKYFHNDHVNKISNNLLPNLLVNIFYTYVSINIPVKIHITLLTIFL